MKEKLTLDAAAEIIDQAGEEWVGSNSKETIYSLYVKTAKKLSKDPCFNAAAWLKANFGGLYSGEDNASWIQSAKDLKKILDV